MNRRVFCAVSVPGPDKLEAGNFHCSLSSQSMCDVLGEDVADDSFQAEVGDDMYSRVPFNSLSL